MDDTTNNPKKKRIKKAIPPSLLNIFQGDSYDGKNLNSFIKFRLENNPMDEEEECMVAYEAKGTDGTIYNLEKELNCEQLRTFSRMAGCKYVNSMSKFTCRRALHILSSSSINKNMGREETVIATAMVGSEFKNLVKEQSLSKSKRCDRNQEVDDKVGTEVEQQEGIKGDSDDLSMISLEESLPNSQKKRTYSAIDNLNNVFKLIAEQMKESNRILEQSNRLREQSNLIQLATALGKKELLQSIFENMTSQTESI
jgi:hypothetical protein